MIGYTIKTIPKLCMQFDSLCLSCLLWFPFGLALLEQKGTFQDFFLMTDNSDTLLLYK